MYVNILQVKNSNYYIEHLNKINVIKENRQLLKLKLIVK